MHQDCLTSACGAYDGVPLWLIERLPRPPRELAFPWPFSDAPPQSSWYDYLNLNLNAQPDAQITFYYFYSYEYARAIEKTTRSHPPRRWDVYFTYADAHYWQCLYRNELAAVSYWACFWRVVASEFGACENLLGYELVNEPWAGNQCVDLTMGGVT